MFLVQAEVAARLTAVPGTRDFGYLSVEDATVLAPGDRCFPCRAAFHPPPKVDSAVVRLEPRDAAAEFGICDPPAFLVSASACFRHKRKTLRNNLAGTLRQRIAWTRWWKAGCAPSNWAWPSWRRCIGALRPEP